MKTGRVARPAPSLFHGISSPTWRRAHPDPGDPLQSKELLDGALCFLAGQTPWLGGGARYDVGRVQEPTEPIPLRYADRPEQYGVLLEESPGCVRITIPPRFLKSVFPSIVVELDAVRLRFETVVNMWNEADAPDRPRAAIYEIKFVKHSGNLFIRAHGYDIVECRPHRDPRVVEWIAERLNAAMMGR